MINQLTGEEIEKLRDKYDLKPYISIDCEDGNKVRYTADDVCNRLLSHHQQKVVEKIRGKIEGMKAVGRRGGKVKFGYNKALSDVLDLLTDFLDLLKKEIEGR